MPDFKNRLVLSLAAATLAVCGLASGANGATLNELSVAGGDFSDAWSAPTVIGNGYDTIAGTGAGNNFDMLAFTGLSSGAQRLTFDFSAPAVRDWSYSAGGALLYSTQPFRWGWDGVWAGTFQTSYWTPNAQVTLDLGPAFAGTLYVGLYFTHGSNLAYTISAPGNALVAPPPVASVPVPASAIVLLGGLAALGGLRRRRRA